MHSATETEKQIGDLRDAGTPSLNLRFADGILILAVCQRTCEYGGYFGDLHKVLLQLYRHFKNEDLGNTNDQTKY